MKTIKVILGSIFLCLGALLGLQCAIELRLLMEHPQLDSGLILLLFAVICAGLVSAGFHLISKRASAVSPEAKVLIASAGLAFLVPVLVFWNAAREAKALGEKIREHVKASQQRIEAVERQSQAEQTLSASVLTTPGNMELVHQVLGIFARDREIAKPHESTATIVPETNLVYCLCYGPSSSPLPLELMQGFTNPTPRLITGTNGLAFGPGGQIRERKTGQPVVILWLRGLVIHGTNSDLSIRYTDSARSIDQLFNYEMRDGQWEYHGGLSTTASRL